MLLQAEAFPYRVYAPKSPLTLVANQFQDVFEMT
jgi:hypothetical protein